MPKLTSEIPACGTQKTIIRRRLGHVPPGMSYDEAETIISRLNRASDLPYCYDEGIIAALNVFMGLARQKANKEDFLAVPFEPTWVVQGIKIETDQVAPDTVMIRLTKREVTLWASYGTPRTLQHRNSTRIISAKEDAFLEAIQWIFHGNRRVFRRTLQRR